jgi:hypothetical protein
MGRWRSGDVVLTGAAWLAGGGALALLLGLFLPLRQGGYTLADNRWNLVWALPVCGLVAIAVAALAGSGARQAVGVVMLVGLAAPMAEGALVMLGLGTQHGIDDVGVGVVPVVGGCLALVVAAGLVAIRWRRYVRPLSLRRSGVGWVLVAACAGVVVTAPRPKMLDVTFPAPVAGAVALLGVTFVTIGLVGPWLRDLPPGGGARLVGMLAPCLAYVTVAVVMVQVAAGEVRPGFVSGQAAFAMGACVVPVVAAVMDPGRLGGVMLATWVAAEVAFFAEPILVSDYDRGAAAVFAVGCALAASLAYAIWRSGDTVAPG